MTFTDPQSIQQVWPIYEARLNEEVAEIAADVAYFAPLNGLKLDPRTGGSSATIITKSFRSQQALAMRRDEYSPLA